MRVLAVFRPYRAVERGGRRWRTGIAAGPQSGYQAVERRPDRGMAAPEGGVIAAPWISNRGR